MPSLHRRLLASLAVVVAVTCGAAILTLYFYSRHDFDSLFDTQLSQTARLTLAVVVSEAGSHPRNSRLHPRVMRIAHALHRQYHRTLAVQVIAAGGRMAIRTPAAPNRPFTRVRRGFSDVTLGRIHWRVYSLSTPGNVWTVQVADEKQQRKTVATALGVRLWWFLPLYLIPLIALIWFSIHRSLKPLDEISRLIAHRNPNDLAPIDKHKAPKEIGPIIDALNGLFAKLDAAMQRERDFVAHAAHELRTPLAALKAQAETALASVDSAARTHALRQIIVGVDRAGHLIGQLLALARLDSAAFRVKLRSLDLHALCQDVLADIAPAALDKNIDLGLEEKSAGSTRVSGHRDMLALLIRNLVDNAVKYTLSGGAITATVQSTTDEVMLEVRDTGPGVAPEERERIFQRFWRGTGSETAGSGLGLSIVRRIAEVHHATVEFTDPLPPRQQGARVIVRFPQANAD
jgi:two-component system sensor histidine kinase QseC